MSFPTVTVAQINGHNISTTMEVVIPVIKNTENIAVGVELVLPALPQETPKAKGKTTWKEEAKQKTAKIPKIVGSVAEDI